MFCEAFGMVESHLCELGDIFHSRRNIWCTQSDIVLFKLCSAVLGWLRNGTLQSGLGYVFAGVFQVTNDALFRGVLG